MDQPSVSDDDFEDSRYYGNEGDGVQYATVQELPEHDEGAETVPTSPGTPPTYATVQELLGPTESAAVTVMSEKDRKKEEKRLEKERKEQEKKDKQLLKEQEQQIKNEAKLKKSPSMKKNSKSSASQKQPSSSKKTKACRVRFLDGTENEFDVEKTAKGQLLLDMVYEYINLLEREFFSCYYIREETRFWLIPDRKIAKQLGTLPWNFEFGVKFYAPEPAKLAEDITRYQMCLQLRQDVLTGRLPCSQVTDAILGAFIAQAELGDYEPDEHGTGADYLHDFEFCPDQTPELVNKIAQIHRTLRGQTPADAELNFLENAKKLELYGVELQSAKDAELVDIMVGVSAFGIGVYRTNILINRFPWPLVLKMAYKSDKFYVKIRPAAMEKFVTTIVFKMPSHDLAKRFWRLCIEHHSFFRLKQPIPVDRTMFDRFGSSRHRFSGRTYYQSRIYASSVQRMAPYFERASSRQLTMSRSLGSSYVDETTRSARRKAAEAQESSENPGGHYEQVSVVAGTGPEASRVAFVKTVRPGEAEQEVDVHDTSRDHYKRYQPQVQEEVVMVHSSPASNTDTSFSYSTEAGSHTHGPPPVAPKKRNKIAATETTVSTVTEYKSEKNGAVETTVERRQFIGRPDIDHDMELSKAITSVVDMDADLSVDKIQINPSDMANAMVGAGGESTFQIAPSKTKKTKKKNKHEVIAE